jgi:hypothetical protein
MNLCTPTKPIWIIHFFSDRWLRCFSVISLVWLLLPEDGVAGLNLCWFHAWMGLPCPGCGLTRSGSSLIHGNIAQAIRYHPFGLIVTPFLLGMGLIGLLPGGARMKARAGMVSHADLFERMFVIVLFLLVAFGLVRLVGAYEGWIKFPLDWQG